jgi:hypothetical protein
LKSFIGFNTDKRKNFKNDFEISDYSLKQYLKLNKFENIKFTDQVKRNKWKLTRDRVNKIWIGFRLRESDN